MPNKEKILAGRKAVETYRTAHTQLHSKPWHRGIPEEHTPLLNAMLNRFKEQGFNSIQEFFEASRELSIQTFKECYIVEGDCSHQCHGIKEGCPESWYQGRMVATQGEGLEPIITIDEAYECALVIGAPKYLAPACTYRIAKVKEPDTDWRWS